MSITRNRQKEVKLEFDELFLITLVIKSIYQLEYVIIGPTKSSW